MKNSSLFQRLPQLTRGKAWFAGSAVLVLSVAGAAVAASGPASTSAVAATFSATTVSNMNSQSCTGSDGTYQFTHATYTGTSTSADPHLNGPITLDVSSVYNTTKNLGWVSADVQVDSSTAGDSTNAKLTAVDANGTVQGFLVSGKIGHGNGDGHGNGFNLAANVTGSFTGAGGFTAGSLGTGAATDTAVITTGSCNTSGDGDNDDDSGGHGPNAGTFGATGATGPTGSFGSPHGFKHAPSFGHGDDD